MSVTKPYQIGYNSSCSDEYKIAYLHGWSYKKLNLPGYGVVVFIRRSEDVKCTEDDCRKCIPEDSISSLITTQRAMKIELNLITR